MMLVSAGLLLLVGLALADVQWMEWHSPRNQGRSFRPSKSRNTALSSNTLESYWGGKRARAPAVFHPRALASKTVVSPVQAPFQDFNHEPMQQPGHDTLEIPQLASPQDPDQLLAQSPAAAMPSFHPAVGSLETSSLATHAQGPALTSGPFQTSPHEPGQNPLLMLPDLHNVVPPAQSPVQISGHAPGLHPDQAPVHSVAGFLGTSSLATHAQGPALTSGSFQTSPLEPAHNPLLDLHPVVHPAQSPVQISGHAPGLHPDQAPVHSVTGFLGTNSLATHTQGPALTSGSFQTSPLEPAHKPLMLDLHPVVPPARNPVQISGHAPGLHPDQAPVHSVAGFLGTNPLATHAQGPALTSGSFQMSPLEPAHNPLLDLHPVVHPVQSPVQISGHQPGLHPDQAPVHSVAGFLGTNSLATHAQGPALTSGSFQMSPLEPAHNPLLDLHPVVHPAQSPVQISGHAPGLHPAQAPFYPPVVKDIPQIQMGMGSHKLTWRFPEVPERTQQPLGYFNLPQPAPAKSVAVACGESMVQVEVKEDLFGTGHLINPNSLTLGGCAAVGQDPVAQVLIFQSELQACHSVLKMTEKDLIYSFNLIYNPEPLVGTPIVRLGAAVIHVECHYSRQHNVSSHALVPSWVPYSSTEFGEEHMDFALKLMTDDWAFERPSNQYMLGDIMHIEASILQFNHAPLRVFVDSCVATAVPDANAVPRYSFIENHGCLTDAKITGSNSHFMHRVEGDKLQFQLEVFMFEQDNSSSIYITCYLKASMASYPTDAEHKACSFTANGWLNADADDNLACGCCDSKCSLRKGRSTLVDEESMYEAEVLLGPIEVKDNL
ncbi:uncharacterized protein [Hoplias malabaricus]|uniref:uncharacterized protein n=1 Tax=Hoplias malabaricus TaxID=27720 RepID=UPI003462A643